jgi:hypothetical protein
MADETAPAAAPVVDAAPVAEAPVANLLADNVSAKPVEAAVEKPVEAAKPVVPEVYEYTPPDGMKVEPEALNAFTDKAKELGLSQDQYKTLVDFALSRDAANAAAPGKAWGALQESWRGEVMNDPKLSDGKGLLPDVSQSIARVSQEFGSPELMKALQVTGAGNNPDVVRFFAKIGAAMGDAGSLQFGKPASNTPRGNSFEDVAARLYPNMNN